MPTLEELSRITRAVAEARQAAERVEVRTEARAIAIRAKGRP